jgi:hypothetical protein
VAIFALEIRGTHGELPQPSLSQQQLTLSSAILRRAIQDVRVYVYKLPLFRVIVKGKKAGIPSIKRLELAGPLT